MKNIITLLIILSLCASATSLSHEEIIKMVSKIKEERVGISLKTLEDTPNPFAIVEPTVIEEVVTDDVTKVVKKRDLYILTAILNHAAFIDKKWYRVGDELGMYRVSFIGRDRVTLKSDAESKELIIPPREKKFKMFKGN